MKDYAVLIDGGFLKKKISRRNRPADIHAVRGFIRKIRSLEELQGHNLYRIYYYDAPPYDGRITNPISRRTLDFSRSEVAAVNENLLKQLAREPFFSLRLGELTVAGWRFSQRGARKIKRAARKVHIDGADLQPHLMQKGVDMRIGMDIASLALKRQVRVIVLVTADSDLIPATRFAREEGVQLFLIRLRHGVMERFMAHVDLDVHLVVSSEPK